ncbi:MAG: hypothetical protein R3244_10885, partial [Thermoanaerobaculia bacterium]|nr:hypothetical protein [Thermoanaerobaculia bacterium]
VAAAYAEILTRVGRDRPQPFRAAPPLEAGDDRPVLGRLLASVGSDLADLGVSDADPAVESVAVRLAETGLGEAGQASPSRID